jgi:signal transduction histidine kinase
MRFYIANTDIDLADHRKAAIEGIKDLHARYRGEFSEYEPVDPDSFCDTTSSSIDRRLMELKDCSYFVLILGWRYGCIPKGSSKSVTELEYEAALEQAIPRFCFVIDDALPVPLQFRESETSAAKLRQFKLRVQEASLAVRFSDPSDLRHQVTLSLSILQRPTREFTQAGIEYPRLSDEYRRNREQIRRLESERDSIWKDIALSAGHKLGNPIFSIETYLVALERRVADGRKEEALAIIRQMSSSVEKAKHILGEFKSFTRAHSIQTGAIPLREILEGASTNATNQGISCRLDCPKDLVILADAEKLNDCFDELIRNAIRWFNKPQKQIEIVAAEATPPPHTSLDSTKPYVVIHFRDNGCGVPAENKERIFGPFFTTRASGSGLGLALVRSVVKAHGGEVFEVGLEAQGADFLIWLPLLHRTDDQLGEGPWSKT